MFITVSLIRYISDDEPIFKIIKTEKGFRLNIVLWLEK